MGRQRRCENITAVGIHDNVQLSPRAGLGWTLAWNVSAMDAQTGAVDNDTRGFWVCGQRLRDIATL
jgi:hypothetical protein